MSERLPNQEGGSEELSELVERLREIHFDAHHPRNQEINEDLMRAHRAHPEWENVSTAWHRVVGSTPHAGAVMGFDAPDGSVGFFIKQLADKYLS